MIFDDLCTNFKHHEELDESHALVTITKTAEGDVTGASLDISSKTVSVIPITVPTSSVDKARTVIASWFSVFMFVIPVFFSGCGRDILNRACDV